jgi:hypothetical protein
MTEDGCGHGPCVGFLTTVVLGWARPVIEISRDCTICLGASGNNKAQMHTFKRDDSAQAVKLESTSLPLCLSRIIYRVAALFILVDLITVSIGSVHRLASRSFHPPHLYSRRGGVTIAVGILV